MKIKNNINKNKFKELVYDAECFYFFAVNGGLMIQWQKIAKKYLEFLYELDINNEVEHGQFIFPPSYNNNDALKIFNEIMYPVTGVKYRKSVGDEDISKLKEVR